MKPIEIDVEKVTQQLSQQVADLSLQLATEVAVKNEVIKYAESLEKVLEENGIEFNVV